MVSRPNWKGYLKLSLVSCPVAMYNATSSAEKVSFHLLNRATGNRLHRQMIDPDTGQAVTGDEVVHGYEASKGRFVTVEDDELAGIALESTHTIDVDQFVDRSEVNDVYLDAPYYLVPNDKMGAEAFAVIREAMRKRGMAGIARVVLSRRERIVLLEPRGRGIVATTLRYAYEIKGENGFFADIPDVEIAGEMLDLAEHIIDKKKHAFDPDGFKDRYETALLDLIKAKQAGTPQASETPAAGSSNVVDLMEALRRSVRGESAKSGATPARASGSTDAKKPAPSKAKTVAHTPAKPAAAKPARTKPAPVKAAPAKAPARIRKAS